MFGQLAGRSVFNTPTRFTHFRPIFGLLFENVVGTLTGHFLAPPFFVAEEAAMLAIVHAWSAWRALQRCIPHHRQRILLAGDELFRMVRAALTGAAGWCSVWEPA